MKRSGMLFGFVLLTMAVGTAQQDDGVELSLSSGFAFPASPMTFANYWNMEYGGGLRAGIPLSESITLLGALEYYRFKVSENGLDKAFDTKYMRDIWIFKDVSMKASADPSSVTTVSANLRVAPSEFSGALSPYLIAGAGVMRFSLGEIRLPTTSVLPVNGSDVSMTAQQTVTGGAETSAFFQLGVGFDVRIAESFDVFVEARYASGLNRSLRATYVPLTAGVKVRL